MSKMYKQPEESGNYLTDLGWCYYDLKDGIFTQAGDDVLPNWWEEYPDKSEPNF